MIPSKVVRMALAVLAVSALTACGGSSGDSAPASDLNNGAGAGAVSTVPSHTNIAGEAKIVDRAGDTDLTGFANLQAGADLLEKADYLVVQGDKVTLFQGGASGTVLGEFSFEGGTVNNVFAQASEGTMTEEQGQEQSVLNTVTITMRETHGCEQPKEEEVKPEQEQGQKEQPKEEKPKEEKPQEQGQEQEVPKCEEVSKSISRTYAVKVEQQQKQDQEEVKPKEEQPKEEKPKEEKPEEKPEQKPEQEQGQKP